jgi:bacillithiol system protein YtxJ
MNTIDTEQELGALVEQSNERPVLIFKHSNACPISARAHAEVRRLVEGAADAGFGFGMVVVQEARSLSNAIERRFGVRHETPQAIVVRSGKAVWNASHFDVTRDRLSEALEGA